MKFPIFFKEANINCWVKNEKLILIEIGLSDKGKKKRSIFWQKMVKDLDKIPIIIASKENYLFESSILDE